MVSWLGMRQVINHYFCRSKDLLAPPVAALENLEDGFMSLSRIVALRNRFMPTRIKRLADDFLGLDAVLADQQAQLLQRHLHTLMKLPGAGGGASGQSPFEVVDDGQQFL